MEDHYSGERLPLGPRKSKTAPVGRICADEECDTVLSRYNDTAYCSSHPNPRKAKRELLRAEPSDDGDTLEVSGKKRRSSREVAVRSYRQTAVVRPNPAPKRTAGIPKAAGRGYASS